MGTLLFAAACGVGAGLLAAPTSGEKTRKVLRKRLVELGGDVLDRWGDVEERLGSAREVGAAAGKRMRKRLSRLREDAAHAREAIEERWDDAKRWREQRLEDALADLEEEEDEGSGFAGTLLAFSTGAALAYLLTAERAEPVRSKVQEAASDLRRRASDRWDQFQRKASQAETGGTPASSSEAPQAS